MHAAPLLAVRKPSAQDRRALTALERELDLGDPGTWVTLAVRDLACQRLGDLSKALDYHDRSAQVYVQSGARRSPLAHLAHALALLAHGDVRGGKRERTSADEALAQLGSAPSAIVRALDAEVREALQLVER